MNATRSQAQRPEQLVEIRKRSSADQSERATKRPLDVGDAFNESAGNNHSRRRRGEIKKSAVHVQEKRRLVGLGRVNAHFQHVRSLECTLDAVDVAIEELRRIRRDIRTPICAARPRDAGVLGLFPFYGARDDIGVVSGAKVRAVESESTQIDSSRNSFE
jgi:hypothetical protein